MNYTLHNNIELDCHLYRAHSHVLFNKSLNAHKKNNTIIHYSAPDML